MRTDLQGRGLGRGSLRHLVIYAQADGIGRIEGFVLNGNERMLAMCREFGFQVATHLENAGLPLATLDATIVHHLSLIDDGRTFAGKAEETKPGVRR